MRSTDAIPWKGAFMIFHTPSFWIWANSFMSKRFLLGSAANLLLSLVSWEIILSGCFSNSHRFWLVFVFDMRWAGVPWCAGCFLLLTCLSRRVSQSWGVLMAVCDTLQSPKLAATNQEFSMKQPSQILLRKRQSCHS